MRKRKLGNSELELTTVGLGTWAIGGPWEYGWGPQSDRDSFEAIREAREQGINWIDTAAVYGCGHSEEVLGNALRELGWKPVVATKCGLLCDEQRRKVSCLDAASIKKECEDSLRRLKVEVIDLYQMHWPQPEEQLEEGWAAMAELVKEGKVRYIGASNFSVEQLEMVSQIHPVTSLQPPYSMFRRGIETSLLPYCRDNNIGIVAYSPMDRGLLTGKFTHQKLEQLAPDDNRHKHPLFSEPNFSHVQKCLSRLKPIAADNAMSLAQLAIAWTIRDRAVTSAIVGARKSGQIGQTAPAADMELSDADISRIESILKDFQNSIEE
jgi:aryl-alcohol dehydrogenase-like predicted oxidoreductase